MPLSLTDNDIYDALIGFFELIVPSGTPILRGQQNRVPQPNVDYVLMTTLGAPRRIGTNADSTEAVFDADGNITGFVAAVTTDYEYRVQADFYSSLAESWAIAAEQLWRDTIGWTAMPAGMKPLYTEDARQLPLIGAENQWIQRWTMTLVLDYQPTWMQPTEAATAVTVIPEPIDVFLPPAWTADNPDVTADSNRTI